MLRLPVKIVRTKYQAHPDIRKLNAYTNMKMLFEGLAPQVILRQPMIVQSYQEIVHHLVEAMKYVRAERRREEMTSLRAVLEDWSVYPGLTGLRDRRVSSGQIYVGCLPYW